MHADPLELVGETGRSRARTMRQQLVGVHTVLVILVVLALVLVLVLVVFGLVVTHLYVLAAATATVVVAAAVALAGLATCCRLLLLLGGVGLRWRLKVVVAVARGRLVGDEAIAFAQPLVVLELEATAQMVGQDVRRYLGGELFVAHENHLFLLFFIF